MEANMTQAPWTVKPAWSDVVGKVWEIHGPDGLVGKFLTEDDAEGAALAHNAEEVMVRRQWGVRYCHLGFWVDWSYTEVGPPPSQTYWPNPSTALVKGDEWMKAQEEKKAHACPTQSTATPS